MRNIILTILGVLLYHSSYAQDPRLFNNNWYFASGELDEVALEIPFPSFVTILTFSSIPPIEEILIHYVNCEETNGTSILYDPIENIFNLQGSFGGLVGICSYDFMADHLAVYYDDNINAPKNPFNYLIVDDGTNLQLTISNGNGDHVIYNNTLLSHQDFDVLSLSFYPNPVEDELFFSEISDWNFYNVLIFDLNGRLVLSLNDFDKRSINLQELKSGLYFMRLNDNLGRSVIKKFIKS